jgi:hypothetical protein
MRIVDYATKGGIFVYLFEVRGVRIDVRGQRLEVRRYKDRRIEG